MTTPSIVDAATDAVAFQAFYELTAAGGRRVERGSALYDRLRTLAENGYLPRYRLLIEALLATVQRLGGVAGLAEPPTAAVDLLVSCPTLPTTVLERLDARLAETGSYLSRRPAIARHPNATPTLWLAMLARASTPELTDIVRAQPSILDRAGVRPAIPRLDDGTTAAERPRGRRAETVRAARAIRLCDRNRLSVEHCLELCGVGPTTATGLCGGGRGVEEPNLADFDPDLLDGHIPPERLEALHDDAEPTRREERLWTALAAEQEFDGEMAEQFDIWRIRVRGAPVRYAITYRDDDGDVCETEGLFASLPHVRAALKRRYFRVEIWRDGATE